MRDGKGGWHDAGDFGKYTGNAGVHARHVAERVRAPPRGLEQAPLPIPESGRRAAGLPGRAALGARLDAQDDLRRDDGRVIHKLTALGFEAFVAARGRRSDAVLRPVQQRRDGRLRRGARAGVAHLPPVRRRRSRISCLAAARTAYGYLDREHGQHAARPDRLLDRRIHNQRSRRSAVGRGRDVGDDGRRDARWPTSRPGSALYPRRRRWSSPDFDWGSVRNLGLYTYLLSARRAARRASVDRVSAGVMTAANARRSAHDASGYGRGVSNNSGAPSYYWGSNGSVARDGDAARGRQPPERRRALPRRRGRSDRRSCSGATITTARR